MTQQIPKFLIQVDTKLIFDICKFTGKFTTFIPFKIDKNGLEIRLMDNAHVCMIHCILNPFSFERFICEGEFNFELPVNEVLKALSNFKENIDFSFTDDNRIIISDSKKSCEILIREHINEYYPLPKLDPLSEIEIINKKDFDSAISFFTSLNNQYVHFILDSSVGQKFKLLSKSCEGKSLVYLDIYKSNILENVDVKFTLEYLIEMKYLKIFDKLPVKIFLRSKFPCIIEFKHGKDSFLHFYLAPRVVDE